MEMAGGRYLNTTRALPGDFTLTIGDHEFVASDSLEHYSVAAGRYWWPADNLTWSDGDEVQVSITPIEGSQALAPRDKASPIAYAFDIPESHDGTSTFAIPGRTATQD